MLLREVLPEEKNDYNKAVSHVMQSYEWGSFREAMGVKVYRIGVFENDSLLSGFTVSIHPIPHTNFTVGYLPKGGLINQLSLSTLKKMGAENNCIFIKLEPNIEASEQARVVMEKYSQSSVKALFTKYTFQLDLTRNETEIFSGFKEKTRYNVRLSEKKGVIVREEFEESSFEDYLKLMRETTKRNGFFAHDDNYHRTMWKILRDAGIAHLMVARFNGEALTAWIVFVFNEVLYYPYGSSSSSHRELMSSNLMMWEAIKFGKKMGCKLFDMWGSLGADPDSKDPWYGFHRFKEGYSPRLVEFVGSYDIVINPSLYPLYFKIDKLRWNFLKTIRLFKR